MYEMSRRQTRAEHLSRGRAVTPSSSGHRGTAAARTILSVITQRRSARVEYDPDRRPSTRELGMILEAARWAPTAHNMQNFQIVVIDDPALILAFQDLESRVSEVFLEENYRQMSFSEGELRRKKTGVLASTFPPLWRSLADIRSGRATAAGRRKLGETMQPAPVLLLVLYDCRLRAPASEGDVLGKISLGCALENIWLMAEALGISCQVVSAFSGEEVERSVMHLIDAPRDMRIAVACRLGYPISDGERPIRVRRDVQDFTHHNRYALLGLH